jgi:hypothetical protein
MTDECEVGRDAQCCSHNREYTADYAESAD